MSWLCGLAPIDVTPISLNIPLAGTYNRVRRTKTLISLSRTALQWIHKCRDIARGHNYFPNGSSHAWVEYYYRKITSDRIGLNEW